MARVLSFETIDSTNAEAQRLAEAGERGPAWIRAARQTAGRGRQGRPWVSEGGNLYATLLVTPLVPPRIAVQAGFVAGLAVLEAVRNFLPDPSYLALKWPNDVLLDERKIAGILTETAGPGERDATTIAIGCGVNLAHAPDQARYPATSLRHHGVEAEPEAVFAALQGSMDRWLGVWDEGRGFARIRQAWLASAFRLGREVTLLTEGEPVSGVFSGLAEDGAIVVVDAMRRTRAFHAGEVSLSAPGMERAPT